MTDGKPKAEVKMVPNKDNILVPADTIDRCIHEEVVKRIKPQLPEYHCHGCDEKLKFITLTWALMTEDEFNTFRALQAKQIATAIRQRKTGLVTPGEAEAEKQRQRQPQTGAKVVPPRKGPA